MTLSIEISGKYHITSDEHQIVIQRKHTVDPTKAPGFNPHKLGETTAQIREEWRNWKFCGKVPQALEIIAQQNVFESDATDLRQLRDEIMAFNRQIRRAMGEDD